MKTLKNIFFLLLIINFFSCLNCPKPFYTYKQKINFSNVSLKTNGIFVSVNDHGSFYLYSNGKVWNNLSPHASDFWKNPMEVLKDERQMLQISIREWWGDYLIREDSTIIIQTFGDCMDYFCRRMVIEQTGKILTDTTFIIYSMYAYNTKDTIVKGNNRFKYYPTNIKPDSTVGWFNNKKWYKKNLYESRK